MKARRFLKRIFTTLFSMTLLVDASLQGIVPKAYAEENEEIYAETVIIDNIEYKIKRVKNKYEAEVIKGNFNYLCEMNIQPEIDVNGLKESVPVTGIADNAFKNFFSIKSIKIENMIYLKNIGESAFENCSGLSEIEFINTPIETISKRAFANCSSLVSFKIPDSVLNIGESVFEGCSCLKEFIFPESFNSETSIKTRTFANCYSLREFNCPVTINKIEKEAFYNCYSLYRVKFSEKSTLKVEPMAFCSCSSLFKIKKPLNVFFSEESFKDCVPEIKEM